MDCYRSPFALFSASDFFAPSHALPSRSPFSSSSPCPRLPLSFIVAHCHAANRGVARAPLPARVPRLVSDRRYTCMTPRVLENPPKWLESPPNQYIIMLGWLTIIMILGTGQRNFPSSTPNFSRPLPRRGLWPPPGNDGLAVCVREQCSRLSSVARQASCSEPTPSSSASRC